MFEGQPKGLYALALANTGERFGYYTMLAIFTLFLQAKFGFTAAETSTIFGSFLAAVYFMPLIGGILADKFGYGKMVTTGIVVMFIGYVLLSIPTPSSTGKILMFGALALIACGTGLFKGNLQVMVGNLYDAPEYKAKRDTAFSIFYMAINIGAMYAPTAATMITNKMLGKAGFTYVPQLPSLAHQFLNGTITEEGATTLSGLQAAQNFVGDTATFCTTYIDKLSEAYNYGFAIACISLIVSMLIYVVFRPTFKHADYNSKQAKPANVQEEELTPEQTKARIQALLLVCRSYFLLDGLPPEWFDTDILCTRLYRTGRDGIGSFRIQYRKPYFPAGCCLCRILFVPVKNRQSKRNLRACPCHHAWLTGMELQFYGFNGQYPAADLPAVQPVLCNRADSGIAGRIRISGKEKERAVCTA